MELLECGHTESKHSDFTRGYATDSDGKRFCYDCCAKQDIEYMKEHGKIALYLTTEKYGDCKITKWPGSLRFSGRFRKGSHNIAGTRYDCWFRGPDGFIWHGVQYGENTQIVHCKRTKEKA